MEDNKMPTFQNWVKLQDMAYKEVKCHIDDDPLDCFVAWLEEKFPNGVIIDPNYEEVKEEEKEIPITLGMIRASCGWSRYCDVTGGNHYMLKEWSVDDNEIFRTKESHARKLGFIK
jgi:hypothetical protein